MSIKEAQEAVDRWIHDYGVRYFSELTNMACLTEEVGELARVIARQYGDQSFKPGEKPNLGEEMADVLWVLLCLANRRALGASVSGQPDGRRPHRGTAEIYREEDISRPNATP